MWIACRPVLALSDTIAGYASKFKILRFAVQGQLSVYSSSHIETSLSSPTNGQNC